MFKNSIKCSGHDLKWLEKVMKIMRPRQYFAYLICFVLLISPSFAFDFDDQIWRRDARNVIRLEAFSKAMRLEIEEQSERLRDTDRIDSAGHAFVNDIVDKYSRLRRHLDAIRVRWEDCYTGYGVSGNELRQTLKGSALWLAATSTIIENAATMTESFDGSVFEWRLNRPILGKGDIRIAFMFEDMSDLLVNRHTRSEMRKRLFLLSRKIGPLNEAIWADDGVLEKLLRIIAGSSEVAEDRDQSLLSRAAKRIDRRLGHLRTWLAGRFVKRMGQFFRLIDGQPYAKDLGKGKAHKVDLGEAVAEEMLALIKPGDIIVEKKKDSPADWLIPGFWGHTALWLGDDEYLESIGAYKFSANKISYSEACAHRKYIKEGRCVLEAVFTGVVVNNMRHLTYCDAIAILRLKGSHVPEGRTREETIAEIVKRGLYHAGQDYDFWFNVNSHNRIVCSELAYQAFPEWIDWPTGRLGNSPTISPDNVAAMAGPGDKFPFEVIYFVEDKDIHRGCAAWRGFWKRLHSEGAPVEMDNPDHNQRRIAIDELKP